jgi:CRISPR-associated protein Cas1
VLPARGGRPLVLTDPTLLVRHANGRLVMLRDRKVIASIPIADISHVAVHGPITFTGPAIAGLLDAGIDVTLHSSAARLRGVIHSHDPKNVFLTLAQVAAWNDPARRLAFARVLLASKIAGQRQLVHRHARDHGSAACEDATARLAVLERKVLVEDDLDAARGIEGAASSTYFGAFADMVGPEWAFPGRVRRPPRDPVNALLSFGYTLATAEVARHLLRASFDLRIGLVHGIRYGRESLALDLVEELRAPLVDRFTLRLLRRGQLKREDFIEREEDGAVRLTDDARRSYLEWWEETLSSRAPLFRDDAPDDGSDLSRSAEWIRPRRDRVPDASAKGGVPEELTWRFRMERQVQRLARFLLRDAPFKPLQSSRKPKRPAVPDEIDSQRGTAEPDHPDIVDESDGDT